jgi:predicted enzyme related to lactoylglutathione lyase
MPERTSYEPGTPSWVDLATPDLDGAKRFYGSLFGWEAHNAGPPEETGGYAFFVLGGRRVAGVAPLVTEGWPTVWSTYVSVDDADAAAERATAAGATLLAEPMEIMDAGRMTFLMHTAGGSIGAWQAGEHTGAELVNDPGNFTWSELHTHDVHGAKAFGAAVFGWTYEDQPFGEMTYTVARVGETGVAGMVPLPADVPAEVPATWMTYFAVEDCDAAVATAEELGGSVLLRPMDVEGVGRFAVVADPYGAQFGVIRNAPA